MNLQEQIENLSTNVEVQTKNYPDLVSLLLHHLVAVRLRSNPGLIEKAKSNLRNWLKKTPNVAAWLEWEEILEKKTLDEVLAILVSESDEGQRLRSSSPFVGIITAQERKTVIEYCEKAKPF